MKIIRVIDSIIYDLIHNNQEYFQRVSSISKPLIKLLYTSKMLNHEHMNKINICLLPHSELRRIAFLIYNDI